MDVAYDHIQEETLTDDNQASSSSDKTPAQPPTLNAEFQDAYRAFSNSPWGARIGGFLGNVVKQGESVYREAEKELSAVSQDATRGFSDLRTTLISRTRALSIATTQAAASAAAAASSGVTAASSSSSLSSPASKDEQTTPTTVKDLSAEASLKQQQEDDSVLARLRGEAAKRLKDLQKAEDAADEALLRFGSNLRDFLKDAIKIAPPSEEEAAKRTEEGRNNNSVLFESKDAQGKRVIHTSRFDAQLHVIHTTLESFSKEPASGQEYDAWVKEFDVDQKTEAIAADLDKYPELRATMEKLVPDQVRYADFWKRYYFLRHGIETAEARRRDLLKAASAEEEVGWDEDSSDEENTSEEVTSGDDKAAPATTKKPAARSSSTESSTTINPPSTGAAAQGSLKPSEPRKSNDEKSQADSEASYDVVGAASGVPSRAPNSPNEGRKADESSDEEDWE